MTAQSPWKPCDLRGAYPSAVSEELFARVARAIASEIPEGARVVAGGDFRVSTPPLKSALIEGLMSAGLHVVDAGQAPTPVIYFHANRIGAAAVFIVTASHNPAAHNGLKWLTSGRPPSPEDILRIRFAVERAKFRAGRGSVETADPAAAHRKWILGRFAPGHRRVVLDPGNGAWSILAPPIFRELEFVTVVLHATPDGTFPNRPADCARTSNLSALRQAAREQNAVGIAWDGDGDRVAFVDETGEHVSTDEISILLGRHILNGAADNVVCDIKLSDAVRREVIAAGGRPILERSGHAFIRSRILSSRAILGLDACGHYFFRQAEWRDDGLYSALLLLEMLDGRTLADTRREVAPIFSTPELRLPVAVLDFATVLDRLRSAFPDAEENNLDGARFLVEDGLVLVRESSTEPVVSLRIEGFSASQYGRLLACCLASLHEAEAVVRPQLEEYRAFRLSS